MATVGLGENEMVEVSVDVTLLGGVTDGVAAAKQPGYCRLLHSPGCKTPPTQHAQQYESPAPPEQLEHTNSAEEVTELVGVGVAPRLSDAVAVFDAVGVEVGVGGDDGERVEVTVETADGVGLAVGVSVVVCAAARNDAAVRIVKAMQSEGEDFIRRRGMCVRTH